MKQLTLTELKRINEPIQTLVGARLQDVFQSFDGLGLEFFHLGKSIFLWFDWHAQRPMLFVLNELPRGMKKSQRPLTLFLKSRFCGRRLASSVVDDELGRVLTLGFHRASDEGDASPIEIEIRLFPRGQNVIARDGKKSIAEFKPKDLLGSADESQASSTARSPDEILREWLSEREVARASGKGRKQDPAVTWQRDLEKKQKALEKLDEEIQLKENSPDRELGLWLKTHGDLENVPAEWRDRVDFAQSLSWNIENVFRRAKDAVRKVEGTRERKLKVQAEVEKLQRLGPGAVDLRAGKPKKNLMVQAEARGRRIQVADDLDFFVGKSAADNLSLLRKAQPFDYWLHLRDFPGAHGILKRTRNRNVTDAEFADAARGLIEKSRGKSGDRYDVLIVECRFVRPIKGDKLGRVNYSNDRVLTVRF